MLLLTCLSVGISLVTAQNQKVTGVVIWEEDGQPVVGASILVKGTTVGTISDIDGNFTLFNVPGPAKSLVVSFIGMKSAEIAVKPTVKVVLASDAQVVDKVVVTALGISRQKRALGYAVSDISGDEMLKARGGVSNPVNSLQGKIAGLQIQSGSGTMGGSSKILIRGVKSTSGNNQPLFVIDGVPIEGTDYNSTDTQIGAGGYDYGNLVQDLNPDDIENISVLKGPNASALYGSRGTNGVVMITTKKAKKGDGYGVTFNSSVGLEIVNKLPKMQKLYGGGYYGFKNIAINGKNYLYPDMVNNASWGDKYEGQEFVSWLDLAKWEDSGKVGDLTTSKWNTPKHDIDDFFETGVSFTNNIAVSQATDRANVRISYTNSDLTGYMPNSSLTKNIFNASASTISADKRLEVFTNVTYFNSRAKGRPETGNSDNNVMQQFIQWGHRELDMKELKSMYLNSIRHQVTWNRTGWNDPTPIHSNNPYWSRYMNYENDSRNRIYGNVGMSYKILDNLKFQYKANVDFFVDKQYERNAVYSHEQSRYYEISRQQIETNHEFMLSYNSRFKSDFSFDANVGSNFMNRRYEYMFGQTNVGLFFPLIYNLKNSAIPAESDNYLRKKSISSAFANTTLGYKNTYYLDMSLRVDWSSTLPKKNSPYKYPSIAGSFVFSELLKNKTPWLNFGKLRLSYAQVGNDTDPYQTIDTYSQYTNITATPGYNLSTALENSSLKPESTNSYEAGLDMSFLNNRLGFEATFYSSETKNQMITLSTTGTYGPYHIVKNSGIMSNKGVELSVHATPVKAAKFSWESSLVLASNKNKVKKLVDGVVYYRLASAPFKVGIGAIEGKEYGVIWGTDFVYDDKGNKVINEDGTYASTSDRQNIEKVYPDFTGGWNNTFRYKKFDLSVLFDFSKGGHYFSTSYMCGMYYGMLEETAAINEYGVNIRESIANGGGVLLKGVLADGTVNTKRIDARTYGAQYYTGPAAQDVFKSDYLKLREINIGYTIPLSKSYFIKSFRVAAYGRNLAIWGPDVKHFDPEATVTSSGNIQGIEGGALPSVANYGLNFSLKF